MIPLTKRGAYRKATHQVVGAVGNPMRASTTTRDIYAKAVEDPALAFNFGLEIKGVLEVFFTECTGLKAKRKPHVYKEGGVNDFVHKLPGRTEYDDIKLKRGITDSDKLWRWYEKGLETLKIERKAVTIIQFDLVGLPLKRWDLLEAYPVEWSGPDLKTDSSNVVFETVVLAHKGIRLNI